MENVPSGPRKQSGGRTDALRAWLDEKPVDDCKPALTQARQIKTAFFHELAGRIAPVLNEHIRAQPQDTYQEKKSLAHWINHELRALDLAVECPVTHMPAIVVVTPARDHAHGRFQFLVSRPDGKRMKIKTLQTLPDLVLTPRDAGLDKETLWRERGGATGGQETER